MHLPEDAARLAEVRGLITRYQVGGPESLDAFRELVSLLFRLTVLAVPQGIVRLTRRPGERDKAALGGPTGPDDPLPLNDGRFLRVSMSLYLERTPQGARLKVADSSFQYQADQDGDRWIFRYDYLRNPPDPHPAAHLQVNGTTPEGHHPPRVPLGRIHFPTYRVSLEAVIRLLAEQFRVPCNVPPEVWRPIVTESERAFLSIAHQPLSGPER